MDRRVTVDAVVGPIQVVSEETEGIGGHWWLVVWVGQKDGWMGEPHG
jgi:hypothetical protein